MQFLQGFSHAMPWVKDIPVWLTNDVFTVSNMVAQNPDLSVPTIFGVPICINIPAIFIVVLMTAILVKGTRDSAKMAGLMVVIKLAVIALFVIAGAFFVRPELDSVCPKRRSGNFCRRISNLLCIYRI